MSGEEITVQSPDGSFMAYVAKPQQSRAPGIVVIQEIFGVNQVMRDICDGLARQGFIAVCPDLFWRIEPGVNITDKTKEEWDKAFALYGKFDPDSGVRDIHSSINHLRGMRECNGKVGAVGYCLGGLLAYLTAARTDVDAAVGYYGVGIEKYVGEAGNIKKPLMLHVASKDQFVPPEAQAQVHKGLDNNRLVIIHDYSGQDHAFARKGGEHYDKQAAQMADARTVEFFDQNLQYAQATPE